MADDLIVKIEETKESASDIAELGARIELADERQTETLRQLMERLDACQTQLSTLSQVTTAENPMLSQVSSQLAEIKVELATIKSSISALEEKTMNAPPLVPSTQIPPLVEEPVLVVPVSTEEPVKDAPQEDAPPKRRRVNLL